jgi:hypothetical protein
MGTRSIDRPPRIQPELPTGETELPNPPEDEKGAQQVIQQLLLPLITLVGYVVMAASGQGRNPLLMIPMGMTFVASSVFALYSHNKQKREQEKRKQAYAKRLTDLRRDMAQAHDMQRTFYLYNYPDPAGILRIAGGLYRSRSGSRLWERRPGDEDFGAVRLGMGTRPSTVTYKAPRSEKEENDQVRDAQKLAEDSRFVTAVPITIPLRPYTQTAKAASGSAGPKEEGKEAGSDIQKVVPGRHAVGITGRTRPRRRTSCGRWLSIWRHSIPPTTSACSSSAHRKRPSVGTGRCGCRTPTTGAKATSATRCASTRPPPAGSGRRFSTSSTSASVASATRTPAT